jgi:hypothetical protein
MPYTIVLTPPSDQSLKYVEASQALCRDNQPQYLLNTNGTSSPHITVIQFDCSSNIAQNVWSSMCDTVRKGRFEPFSPLFIGISFIDGVDIYQGTTWVELAVKRGDESSPIMKVHYAALEVLQQHGLQPLNASGSDYRPHLTLGRINMPKHLETWSKDLLMNPGKFQLEFGLSDEKWQYAQRLEIFYSNT